jgi:hypothetical protein
MTESPSLRVATDFSSPFTSIAHLPRFSTSTASAVARRRSCRRERRVPVAARYGVSVDAMLSGERFRDTVRARHEWWRLVKDTWDLSYPETGRLVDGVDHTSIMSALRARVDGSLETDNHANHTTKMSPRERLAL